MHGATQSQRTEQNLARLDVLLAALAIPPYDEWSARRFGQLKAQLEMACVASEAGAMISDLDL